jgi:hypothetical protein
MAIYGFIYQLLSAVISFYQLLSVVILPKLFISFLTAVLSAVF